MVLENNVTFWLWLGFVGMGLGTVTLLSFWNKLKGEYRYHVMLSVMVTSIATAAYYAMATGQGVMVIGDQTIFYARYIDWLLTTPLLLLTLVLVGLPRVKDSAHARERNGLIGSILFSDVAMIVTGAIANFSTTTEEKTVWYIASLGWFLIVLWLLYGEVMKQANHASKSNAKKYASLLLFLSVLWVIYPVLWLLGESGFSVINMQLEVAIYAIVDVTAKAVFGVVLLSKLTNNKD